MTRTQTLARLRRLSKLSAIRCAIAQLKPKAIENIGLMDVANACQTLARAGIERECHTARDALLTVACEWDLTHDLLEDQSDACLGAIVDVLR